MIQTVIVADHRRERMASALYVVVDADYLSMDSGRLGCRGNHLQAWQWHIDHPTEWALTLEDDAIPVENFCDEVRAALAVAPTPIVSLYLGRGYTNDTYTGAALRNAEAFGAHWLVGPGPRHAVALAVRGELVEPMVADVRRSRLAVDDAMGSWARRNGYRTAYCVPSLVDHRDTPSLVSRYRRAPRVAWKVGTRKDWNNSALSMA
jgi:hypothetical protein